MSTSLPNLINSFHIICKIILFKIEKRWLLMKDFIPFLGIYAHSFTTTFTFFFTLVTHIISFLIILPNFRNHCCLWFLLVLICYGSGDVLIPQECTFPGLPMIPGIPVFVVGTAVVHTRTNTLHLSHQCNVHQGKVHMYSHTWLYLHEKYVRIQVDHFVPKRSRCALHLRCYKLTVFCKLLCAWFFRKQQIVVVRIGRQVTDHATCNTRDKWQSSVINTSPCAADQGPQLPYSSKSSVHNSRLWFYFCFISKRKECESFGSGDALLKVNALIDQSLPLSTPD